jgi:hypothetical protein
MAPSGDAHGAANPDTEIQAGTPPAASQKSIQKALAVNHPPRFDLYAFIHKALREQMSHTLGQLGRADAGQPDAPQALDAVAQWLVALRAHLRHENDFVHTAIEARQPGGARQTDDDHADHLDAIDQLGQDLLALRQAPSAEQPQRMQRLYRHLAAFIGENLVHMQVEESQNNAKLWALYSDAELLAIHERLVGSIPPAELATSLQWMAAALNDTELAMLYGDLQRGAPGEVFEGLLGLAHGQLSAPRQAQLNRSLGLAPVPGLVSV